jgi:hypothetical protein
MNQTDPRTPPALSNATPRPHHPIYRNGSDVCEWCNKPIQFLSTSHCLKAPAAPPVAEGPAATPRCTNCGHARDAHYSRYIGQPHRCFAELMGRRCSCKAYAAAQHEEWGKRNRIGGPACEVIEPYDAEPPEARAAARKWLDEHFQPHSQSGDYLRRDATDSAEYATWDLMAEYAADLQRQLDNWKANARTAREYWRSAEAANQKLRRGAQKALLPIAALVQSGACVDAPTELTDNIKLAILDAHDTLCALLGPQHGDTK